MRFPPARPFLLAAAAAVLALPPAAMGAAPPAAPTPLAFLAVEGAACPSAADASGATTRDGMASVLRAANAAGHDSGHFMAMLAASGATDHTPPIATLCDPQALTAQRPPAAFGGDLAGIGLIDVASAGLRALVAKANATSPGLRPGDRLELPAVSAASTLDLAVRTNGGRVSARLGPFAAPPVTATVGGATSAPTVQVRLADGTVVEQTVVPPPISSARLRIAAKGARLRLSMHVNPGAIVIGTTPARRDEFLHVYEAMAAADARGNAAVTSAPIDAGTKRFTVLAADLVTGNLDGWNCRLRWQGTRLRRASCTPEVAATGAAIRTAAASARLGLQRGARQQRVSAARASALVARGARAAGAPATRTVVRRIDDIPEGSEDLQASDITGDGKPEVLYADYLPYPNVLVSSASGWRMAKVPERSFDKVAFSPDLDGDGLGGLWLATGRGIAGNAAWSTGSAAPSIDLSGNAPLGPRDLLLPGLASDSLDATPPTPLPDTTGDGRPELLLGTDAVYGSEALTLGRSTSTTGLWPIAPAEAWAAYAKVVTVDLDDVAATGIDTEITDGSAPEPYTAPGTPPILASVTTSGTVRAMRSTVEVRTLGSALPWAPSSTGRALLAGRATVVDGDAVSGETLVLTEGEACSAKRGCVARLRRLDRDGRITATTSMRDRRGDELTARFVADGPDADDRPDVVVGPLEDLGRSGRLRVWSSTEPAARMDRLPVLSAGGKPVAVGVFSGWREAGRPRGVVAAEHDGRGSALISLLELAR